MDNEPSKPQSWWQTLPGILTAVTGILTAATGLIVALSQAGVFSNSDNSVPPPAVMTTTDSPAESPETSETSEMSETTELSGASETSAPTTDDAADASVEQKLLAANIELGPTSADAEKTRGYLAGANSAYLLLADSCVQILDNLRLKKVAYLDVIDKHYTMLVGEENYVSSDGQLNMEKLKEAIVNADNEIHGSDATTFEQIVESR
ncbi:hypothetical protein [Paenibacillus kobensis]|uniref:hypothetical protein n=1 Tax=Paenibacillus kobensis TaxID=59841 RepID=UPI000FDC2074|nr:hypothetical protein [Paenibacillus kobensis]